MKSTYTVSPFLAVSRTELESFEELLRLTPASTYILAGLLLKYVRLLPELEELEELEELSLTIIVSFSFSFSFSFVFFIKLWHYLLYIAVLSAIINSLKSMNLYKYRRFLWH